jgi:hypothetical protein
MKPLLPLNEALKMAQGLHIILQPTPRSVNLWTTDNRIPPELKQTIKANRAEVRRLILQGDIRTCPNPDLHRNEWIHGGNQRYTCEICQRLAYISDNTAKGQAV